MLEALHRPPLDKIVNESECAIEMIIKNRVAENSPIKKSTEIGEICFLQLQSIGFWEDKGMKVLQLHRKRVRDCMIGEYMHIVQSSVVDITVVRG